MKVKLIFLGIKIVLIALLTNSLTGCGIPRTIYAFVSYDCDENDQSVQCKKPDADEYSFLLASKFGVMALFSEIVYQRKYDKKGCNINNDSDLPSTKDGRWVKAVFNGNEGNDKIEPCVNEGGLFYETYIYTPNNALPSEAVIAFRGTEFNKLNDWKTNFSAAFGIEPTEYEIAKTRIPKLIEKLKAINRDIKIYAVGHSLGGGLAQQTGFLSKNIDEVITFNTSPVTNWSSLAIDNSVENQYPIIYRIYHTGEALDKIRNITTSFTSTQYGRYDIGLQFKKKSSFDGHSMLILACGLANIVAKNNNHTKIQHHYDAEFAKKFSETDLCIKAFEN